MSPSSSRSRFSCALLGCYVRVIVNTRLGYLGRSRSISLLKGLGLLLGCHGACNLPHYVARMFVNVPLLEAPLAHLCESRLIDQEMINLYNDIPWSLRSSWWYIAHGRRAKWCHEGPQFLWDITLMSMWSRPYHHSQWGRGVLVAYFQH